VRCGAVRADRGPDPLELRRIAHEVRALMQAHPHTHNTQLDWDERALVLQLTLDTQRLRLIGLTPRELTQQLQFQLGGVPVSELRQGTRFNSLRARIGMPYWSLSQYLKYSVKGAVKYIQQFERAVATEARKRGFDGVVCGHIHHAEIRDIDGTLYCNDGDWVESLTALVEHHDGRLEIVHWPQRTGQRMVPEAQAQAQTQAVPEKLSA